jgi:hypothetical protein
VNNYELLVLNLTGKITPDVLRKRLIPIYKSLFQDECGEKIAIRIKIDITETVQDTFHYLDQLLFKICILKVIEFGPSYLGFDSVQKFYIEVQNTLDDRLLRIDFIRFLVDADRSVAMKAPLQAKTPNPNQLEEEDCLEDTNIEETDSSQQAGYERITQHWAFRLHVAAFPQYLEPLIEDLGSVW